VRLTLRIYAHPVRIRAGRERRIRKHYQAEEECEAGLAARTRLITGTAQGTTG
jgi:hypothetical protein